MSFIFMCIISDEEESSSMKNWKSFKGVKMSWKLILNSLKCHNLRFARQDCFLCLLLDIHTVPNLHFLSKKSTYILVNWNFWTQFDKKNELKIQKKLKNFNFLPEHWSFISSIFGQNGDFWHENSIFWNFLGWNIQEYISILAQKIQICLKVKFSENWFFWDEN